MKKFLLTLTIMILLPSLVSIIEFLSIFFYELIIFIQNQFNYTSLANSNVNIPIFIAHSITVICILLFFSTTPYKITEKLNLKRLSFNKILYIVILCVGISALTSLLTGFLSSIFTSYVSISTTIEQMQHSIIASISAIIISPILEEIIFRGLMFTYLQKHLNIISSVCLQALSFALWHGNIVQGIYTFILGIILALVFLYCKSLYGCILFHIIYNLFGFILIDALVSILPGETFSILILSLIGVLCTTFASIKIFLNNSI